MIETFISFFLLHVVFGSYQGSARPYRGNSGNQRVADRFNRQPMYQQPTGGYNQQQQYPQQQSPPQQQNYPPQSMNPNMQDYGREPMRPQPGGFQQGPPGNMPGGPPNGPQTFHDNMGSEVENEWEQCMISLTDLALQQQLEMLGDPDTLEQDPTGGATTYKFLFRDGSAILFKESGTKRALMSCDLASGEPCPGGAANPNKPVPRPRPGPGPRPIRPGYQPHQIPQQQQTNPSDFQDCKSCVGNQYVWSVGYCMLNCGMIRDAPCYQDKSGCEQMEEEGTERKKCERSTDCVMCTDAGRSCVWDPMKSTCYSTSGLFFEPQGVIRDENECPSNRQPPNPRGPGGRGRGGRNPGGLPGRGPTPGRGPNPEMGGRPNPNQRPMVGGNGGMIGGNGGMMGGGSMMPGGWSGNNAMDPRAMNHKWNEVLEHNQNSALISATDLEVLDEPESVSTQVVQGLNYNFQFNDGTQVLVWEREWLREADPSNYLVITNVTPPGPNQGGRFQKLRNPQAQESTSSDVDYRILATAMFGGILAGVVSGVIFGECFIAEKVSNDDMYDIMLDAQRTV